MPTVKEIQTEINGLEMHQAEWGSCNPDRCCMCSAARLLTDIRDEMMKDEMSGKVPWIHTALATPEDVDRNDDTLSRLFDWAFEPKCPFTDDTWSEYFRMLMTREHTVVTTSEAYLYAKDRVQQFIDYEMSTRIADKESDEMSDKKVVIKQGAVSVTLYTGPEGAAFAYAADILNQFAEQTPDENTRRYRLAAVRAMQAGGFTMTRMGGLTVLIEEK